MRMIAIYPEPNGYKLSEGSFNKNGKITAYLDEQVKNIFPSILEKAGALLNVEIGPAQEDTAPIIFRKLEKEDRDFAGGYFKGENRADIPDKGVYFVHAEKCRLVIAALEYTGFVYALQTLKQMVLPCEGDSGARVKCGVVFDYPFKSIRAVEIESVADCDAVFLARLIETIAGLKYNAIVVRNPESKSKLLEKLCTENRIDLWDSAGTDDEVINPIDGPGLLDWEHKSARPELKGAVVAFKGMCNEKTVMEQGFLFNLVYSSYVLWKRDYNNFSWEKVAGLSMTATYKIAQALFSRKLPTAASGDADVFPVALASIKSPVVEIPCGSACRIAQPEEKAASLIFSHAIKGDAAQQDKSSETDLRVGSYRIKYEDDSVSEIQLLENVNTGLENIRQSRKYNPWTHAFDTDVRLQMLSAMTSPVKIINAEGGSVLAFNYEWVNPEPDKAIREISVAVSGKRGMDCLKIYSVDIVKV